MSALMLGMGVFQGPMSPVQSQISRDWMKVGVERAWAYRMLSLSHSSTPLLAASRATPLDLVLDLLSCVILVGKAASTPQAFGDASAGGQAGAIVAWLVCTWCFALPQLFRGKYAGAH